MSLQKTDQSLNRKASRPLTNDTYPRQHERSPVPLWSVNQGWFSVFLVFWGVCLGAELSITLRDKQSQADGVLTEIQLSVNIDTVNLSINAAAAPGPVTRWPTAEPPQASIRMYIYI